MDPDQIAQIQLLNEAVLKVFAVDTNPVQPNASTVLRWDVTMPTTVIPGVHPRLRLYSFDTAHPSNPGFRDVDPTGSESMAPIDETTHTMIISTPLASRQLGSVGLGLDFSHCVPDPLATGLVNASVISQIRKGFGAQNQVSLRGEPTCEVHLESVVVAVPLTASIPNWIDPTIDIVMEWQLKSEWDPNWKQHVVRCNLTLAKTDVSFGAASSVASAGVTAVVASAVEQVSDGYLYNFVGPNIATKIEDFFSTQIQQKVSGLNSATPRPPSPYAFHDLAVTNDVLMFRYCPAHPGAGHMHNLPNEPLDNQVTPVLPTPA